MAKELGQALRRRRLVDRLDQRLGQPPAEVVLAFGLGGTQPVDRQPRDHRHQPGFLGLQLRTVGALPAQPGVLQHVVGVGARAEHAVGDAEQARAVGGEGIGAHVDQTDQHPVL
jgi:hypothetical protein